MSRGDAGGFGYPIALLTSAELPAIDRHMAETGTSGYELMERAGAAVAREVETFAPNARRVVVVSGPNNNGGDCMCAARIMRDAGRTVVLAVFGDPAQLPPDPAKAAGRWSGPFVKAAPEALAGADLIIDGLYGGGVKHDITGEAAAIVAAINASPAKVLSVDFPTGISGVTGGVLGTAVKADRTLTFFCLKPGQLLMPGRLHCGPVSVDAIGIPASVMDTVSPKAFHNRPELWASALQRSGTRSGRVLVTSGTGTSPERTRGIGAGAQAFGAELTTSHGDAAAIACTASQSGGSGALETVFAAGIPVAVNVDEASIAPDALARICGREQPTVLVFEANRFATAFHSLTGNSMLERVREAAKTTGAVVVHLGPDRVVAGPDWRGAISNNAAPQPITEEMSDVVTGAIAGFLAQGTPAFEAAAAAVWLLGDATRREKAGIGANLLPGAMSVALHEIRGRAD